MDFDYIIAGSGCAGLSLLYRILQDETLQEKKILVLDQEKKVTKDRTWCFWEKENGLFEKIVKHQWKILEFKTENFTNRFELENYSYKMIDGLDFYNHVFTLVARFKNVEIRYEEIIGFDVSGDSAIVRTSSSEYKANYIFNSTSLLNPEITTKNSLLQHFMGWEISTEDPVFDENVGTLMDFSLDQTNGSTFMYVLPTSPHHALIEYTLFSEKLLEKSKYREELRGYINGNLGISKYNIEYEEFGVIPMTMEHFEPMLNEKIINIGTAGGQTKASSGYTFQFIQKNTEKIVNQLRNGRNPVMPTRFREKMFNWYDRTLLDVIISGKMTGKEIFTLMFSKLPPEKILKFLGNESTILEDIRIMTSVPIFTFLTSAIRQIR